MNAGIGTLFNSITKGRKEMDILGSSMVSASATPEITQTQGSNGTIISKIGRLSSPEKLAQLTAKSSEKGRDEGINKYMHQVTDAFGDAKKSSSLQGSYAKMQDALHVTKIDSSSRSKASSAVTQFFSKAQQVSDVLSGLGSEADGDISSTIASINLSLQKIFNNNLKLSGDPYIDNHALSSSEDEAARLSENLSIKYNASSNGKVAVAGNISTIGTNFVSESSYVQFSYDPIAANLSYAFYDVNGKVTQDIPLEIMQDGKLNINCGGKLEGLLEFKTSILDSMKQSLSQSLNEIADGLNIVHNQGVGFPPPIMLTSSRDVLESESLANTSGIVRFLPIGADGRPVTANRSEFNPVSVDLSGVTDAATLAAAINKEAACDSSAGAALGGGVDTQATKFLIDQAALRMDQISEGAGTMSLRLASGSDFDAHVRIREVVINDGVNAPVTINAPGDWTEVRAGEVAMSPQFAFNLPAPFQQTARIGMVVEVMGADGTFATENVSYLLDAGAGNTLQNYTSANYHQAEAAFVNPGLANLAASDATIANAKTTSPFVRASIADDKFTLGGRVAIIGDGKIEGQSFSKYFGLNDLVVKDANGKWKLSDDIASDPTRLAFAHAQTEKSEKVNTLKGVASARASLDLTGGLPGDGDTITINGQEFVFRNAPASVNHVQIGVNEAITIQNLVATIHSGAFPGVTELVTASINANDPRIMDITANHSGIKGNEIAIDRAGAGAHLWTNAQRPAGGPLGVATSLYGGRSEGTDSATASYSLAAGNAANGDTITINGHQFTFGAAPGQIAVGGTEAATITNIRNHLTSGAFPEVTSEITFVANGNVLEMTASNAGSHGNSIQIQCAGVHPVCINATNPGGVGGVLINFEGGTDAFGSRMAQKFGYEVLADNNFNSIAFANPITFADGKVRSLNASFNKAKTEISDVIEIADNNFKISSEVLEIAREQFQSARKLKPEEILLMNVQKNALLQSKLMALQLLQKARTMITGSIG